MKKTKNPCFSNGTEHMVWFELNCDHCWKASIYSERIKDYTKFKCKINAEVIMQIAGYDEISQRTYDITQKRDCPFKQEKRLIKKRRKVKNQTEIPLLFQ